MRALLVILRIALVRLGFGIGSLLGARRGVVLATAHAERLGGNLAAIADELARRAPDVPLRVLTGRSAAGLGGRLRAALRDIRAGYHLARARAFIVDDYYFPIYAVRPHRHTTVVQAWHASGAFKKFGHSLAGKTFGADAAVLDRVHIHSHYDVCLVSSMRVAPHYAEAFGLPLDRFTSRTGIPRTDVLFGEAAERAAGEVRRRYGLDGSRRVILYAPTFRGDRVTDARHNDALDLDLLARELGTDHLLLLRLHPFVRSGVSIGPALRDFVIDASDHPDVNALMLVSDVLVTDYSSAIFEFSLLERPMAFFAPDLEAYERERGFYFDYRSGVPGPVFERTDALAAWLRGGSFDRERVRRFREASFDVADGRASARFVEEVVLPALG